MLRFSLQKQLHTADGEMQLTIDCEINNGEFISLYGPSGAGKTSILRMLAGLMKPQKGFIKMNDNIWFDDEKRIDLNIQQRKIGFVFQDYALFPNMTVKENIAFPLLKNEPKDIVDELLQLTGLQNLSDRKIQTLSGGQQQRVALARAIAKKPTLLLLDEPLSAIGQAMREQLQETLLQLHKKYGLTTILVSHNIDEVVKLSDKIIGLKDGRTQQHDSPKLFLKSINQFTGFVGNIVAVKENEITISICNSVISMVLHKQEIANFNKGDSIEIVYEEKGMALKKMSPPSLNDFKIE